MNSLYVLTPAGQFLNTQHVVTFDIQSSGVDDQVRHQVFATLVNGDRQALASFRGSNSYGQAHAFLTELIERAGAQVHVPQPSA